MANTETTQNQKSAPKTEASPFAPFTVPSFDPVAIWTQSQHTFSQLMADAVTRWQSFGDHIASLEQQVTSQANTAVTQWAQLAKDAIAYGTQLSAEARKLSIETAKKMGVGA